MPKRIIMMVARRCREAFAVITTLADHDRIERGRAVIYRRPQTS